MRVQVVDPPAYTPPYDRSLCAALARAGADVELVTSRFVHGAVPAPRGTEVREIFYRQSAKRRPQHRAPRPQGGRARQATWPATAGRGGRLTSVHYQWLPCRRSTAICFPGPAAGADGARRAPDGGLRAPPRHGACAGCSTRMDAVVALSEFGRERLVARPGSTRSVRTSSPTAPSTTSRACRTRCRCPTSWPL